jgi:hypothetical protein
MTSNAGVIASWRTPASIRRWPVSRLPSSCSGVVLGDSRSPLAIQRIIPVSISTTVTPRLSLRKICTNHRRRFRSASAKSHSRGSEAHLYRSENEEHGKRGTNVARGDPPL